MSKDGLIGVKPAEGRRVRDYRTGLPIPDEGASVPQGDPFFMASLNFGDLVEAAPNQDAPAPPGAEPADDHAGAPAASQAEER